MRSIYQQPVMLAEPSKKVAPDVEGVIDGFVARGDYFFDMKWDGIRCLVYTSDGNVRLVNRAERDITYRYPEIVEAFAKAYPRGEMVFDGEIVCFGDDGKPDFAGAHLRDAQPGPRQAEQLMRKHPATFMAFDMLWNLGHDLRAIPYSVRRQLLQAEASSRFVKPTLQWSRSETDGHTMWKFVTDNGLEGLIAKRGGSVYKAGRSIDWVKLKKAFQISVIATGTTKGTGKRAGTFGAITMTLIKPDSTFISIGEVGTGFSDKQLVEIKQRMDAGELLVLEVELTGIFKDTGKARFPSFKYIRTDVTALECTTAQLDAIPEI